MSSSASSDKKHTKTIDASASAKKLSLGTNEESNECKVNTSSPASSSERTLFGGAATAVTPRKLLPANSTITDTEELNTAPATLRAPSSVTIVAKTETANKRKSFGGFTNQMKENKMKMNLENDTSITNRISGRSLKKSTSPSTSVATSAATSLICAWCNESKMALKYVLPIPSGDKEFCSELCISEFRKVRKKGACNQCGNVIRPNAAPNSELCSTFCLNKAQNRRNSDAVSCTTNNNIAPGKSVKRINTAANSYLPIFDWDEYLKVSS